MTEAREQFEATPRKLKPCPFCGASATRMNADRGHWFIECDGCGVYTPTENFGDPDNKWNTRVNNYDVLLQERDALLAERDRYKAALGYCADVARGVLAYTDGRVGAEVGLHRIAARALAALKEAKQ